MGFLVTLGLAVALAVALVVTFGAGFVVAAKLGSALKERMNARESVRVRRIMSAPI